MDSNNNNNNNRRNEDVQSSSNEAEEDNEILDDSQQNIDESEEGEDLMQNMEQDYREIEGLDEYEQEGLDDQEYSDIDEEQRILAEEQMNYRDQRQFAEDNRIPMAIMEQEYGDDLEDNLRREIIKQQRYMNQQMIQNYHQDDEFSVEHLQEMDEYEKFISAEEEVGNRKKWIKDPRTVKFIRLRFKRFLYNFIDSNNENNDENQENNQLNNQQQNQRVEKKYYQKIREMCQQNRQSIEVDFKDLQKENLTLSIWVANEPNLMMDHINQAALEVTASIYKEYPRIHDEIFIKFKGDELLKDHIRNLRHDMLGKLIRVNGVITRRSQVFNQLKKIVYVCNKCGDRKGPMFVQIGQVKTMVDKLGACPVCQSKGPFSIDQQMTLYRNYQIVTIQEPPQSVSAGRVPRHMEVIITGDNIDSARPGDLVEVVGIYMHRYEYFLNIKQGFPVFSTHIECNNLRKLQDIQSSEINQNDIDMIINLSKQPDIANRIINSIGPSIYGHQHTKTALALAMFGGQSKDLQGKHRIRGDINVLILGDPGCAKSQFLKFVEQTFPRSVFTTGKGATAVGLTASVLKDPITKEWTLEGGAMVLADQGICLIDEFDKMGENDRTSIHEAMEQQSISISKAGIVATLQARCSVIAAANPIKGRYDSQLSFNDNVDLTDPILSRFDILSVVKDEVNIDHDYDLASFVINSHIKNHPTLLSLKQTQQSQQNNQTQENQDNIIILQQKHRDMQNAVLDERKQSYKDIISQDVLRKYLIYARTKVHPKIQGIDRDKITNFYRDLRAESQNNGGLHIAVRHIESIIRMAEAHAKMHLREIVRNDDLDIAISVMMNSFIQSQKYSIAKSIQKRFNHYIKFQDDVNDLLLNKLNSILNEQIQIRRSLIDTDNRYNQEEINEIKIPKSTFEYEAKLIGISEKYVHDFCNSQLFKDKQYILIGNVIVRKL